MITKQDTGTLYYQTFNLHQLVHTKRTKTICELANLADNADLDGNYAESAMLLNDIIVELETLQIINPTCSLADSAQALAEALMHRALGRES